MLVSRRYTCAVDMFDAAEIAFDAFAERLDLPADDRDLDAHVVEVIKIAD